MGKVIVVTSGKGGVGKTGTDHHTGAAQGLDHMIDDTKVVAAQPSAQITRQARGARRGRRGSLCATAG
jgi:hypothetical protein